jgi:endoglucanase
MPALKGMRATKGMPEKFVRWSAEIAAWLDANTDPEWVFYEPLNEPGRCNYYLNDWIPLQDQLIAAIREKAPRHTLILNTGGFQLPWELKHFPTHPDRNSVYAIHYYYPSQFSHQGAVWMSTWYHPLRQVPWPFDEEDLPGIYERLDRKNADYAAHAEKAMRGGVNEGVGKPENIDAHFAELADWSRQNKRPIIINEFGVLKTYADEDSRARWLQYIRESCEKNNFGWSHWEYQQAMGFAIGNPGERVYEEKAGRALGFAK